MPKPSAPASIFPRGRPRPSVHSRKLPDPRPASGLQKGNLDANHYRTGIAEHIKQAIIEQERLGLDVLVHGEAERNDMVEYFGEHGRLRLYPERLGAELRLPLREAAGGHWRRQPSGTDHGGVGEVRPVLTDKPVKGMLTGPVTILCWSFPREDVTRETIAKQIAWRCVMKWRIWRRRGLASSRLTNRRCAKVYRCAAATDAYLQWGVEAFRINAAVAKDDTQIHTHMCYCEFNDIMDSIAALDADVITIETSRSDMELLESFEEFDYPNEIGPGVYDIHSPNVPSVEWIEVLLRKAAQRIPAERLWVNPDCGLKTRGWPETRAALANMVKAAQNLRQA